MLYVFAVLCLVCRVWGGWRGQWWGQYTTATTHKPKSQCEAQTEVREMALTVTISPPSGLGRPAAAWVTDGELTGLGPGSRGHQGPQWRVRRTRLMGRESGTVVLAPGSAPLGRGRGTFSWR